nr:unnamed protein product [Callosobruchus chinensis]
MYINLYLISSHLILKSRTFPDKWKETGVCPIHKSGNRVYTDFAKAFDKLDHFLLLSKLGLFGFTDCSVTVLSSCLHNLTLIHCNLSNLGHLLFLIFIDDLCRILKCDKLLFADD